MVSCSRPRKHWVSLQTEGQLPERFWQGLSTPQLPPRAGPGHSRELRQPQGLAQASGQSGHVLWPEAALAQPEGRGQGPEFGRGLLGLPGPTGEPPLSAKA